MNGFGITINFIYESNQFAICSILINGEFAIKVVNLIAYELIFAVSQFLFTYRPLPHFKFIYITKIIFK